MNPYHYTLFHFLFQSFIAKQETAESEMKYISEEVLHTRYWSILQNRGAKINTNITKAEQNDTYLPLFSSLSNPKYVIEILMKVFGTDMYLFGYGYKITENGVFATCDSYDFDGMCC